MNTNETPDHQMHVQAEEQDDVIRKLMLLAANGPHLPIPKMEPISRKPVHLDPKAWE